MRTFKIIFIGLILLGIMNGCADIQVNTTPDIANDSEEVQYQEIPQNLQTDVAQAENDGRKLYEAYLKGPITDAKIKNEKAKINDLCDANYKAYIVDTNIYFINVPSSSNIIMYGRHYKISADGRVTKSTKTCIGGSIDNAISLVVSHLLSDTPTEFHVFLSLKHKIEINVVTDNGNMWEVKEGKINFKGSL